jgi:hypothetical protein
MVAALQKHARTLARLTVVAAGLAVCCVQGADAPFRGGTEWSPKEKASLEQDIRMHLWKRPTYLVRWLYPPETPRFRATWTNGVVRQVCLSTGSVGFELRVFDEEGRLIEDNIVKTEYGCTPTRLVSVSPIRIALTGTNSTDAEVVVGTLFTKEQAREMIAQEDRESAEAARNFVDDFFAKARKQDATNTPDDKQH